MNEGRESGPLVSSKAGDQANLRRRAAKPTSPNPASISA